MVKKKRGRASKRNHQPGESTEPDELRKAPHSFVITRGNVSGYVQELAKDFRKVMEPFTASSLKSRKRNTLKDFVSVAGPLNVSHLCALTQTELGVYLRVARLPRGPTLTMRVHSYTLSRDVLSSLKKTVGTDKMFANAPLVVLNSFSGEGMHLKLLATTFQNMFPSINLTKVKLNTVRRCVLLSYDPETKLMDFRHYAIRAVPVGLSRGVKKLVQAKVPDLSRFSEISEFITRSGQLSESEVEDDPASHVELPQQLGTRGNMAASKSAVRLVEIGPRLTLQLVKVEEELMGGEVMFHEYVHKTEEEKVIISKLKKQKLQLKESRRKQQEANAERKQVGREQHKQRSMKGLQHNEKQVDDDDDAEWYRTEVGQEPEKDLFDGAAIGFKRKAATDTEEPNNKRQRFGRDASAGSKKQGFQGNKKPRSDREGSDGRGQNREGRGSFSPDKRGGKFNDKSQAGERGKFGNNSFEGGGKFGNKSFEGRSKFGNKPEGRGKFGSKSSEGRGKFGNKSSPGTRGKSASFRSGGKKPQGGARRGGKKSR